MRKFTLPAIFLILVFSGCSTSNIKKPLQTTDRELENLALLMEGKFTSEAQSKSDTSYFNISLVMSPIWSDKKDGMWLYVEQAVASKLDKPYRQRIYHLQHPSKNIFTSDIYTIKDPLSFAGLQDDNIKRDKLKYDLIDLKEGCTVTLVYHNNMYEGGTEEEKCPSDLRGAKYATTKIMLKKGELDSWDRGFDATGKQVWGATKGGYIFIRK